MARIAPPSECSYPSPVVIEGIELLGVELDSTLSPIEGAPAPQRLDDRKAHTEPDTKRQRETGAVIVWINIEWRVVRIGPRAVDRRAVDRRVDELRIGRLDNNALALGRYLRSALTISRG